MMVQKKRVIAAWLAVNLVGFSAAAHAYLDPGTGSILVQSLLAGIAGAAAVVSLYWQRVKAFFVNLRKSSRDAHSATSTDNDGI
jgi:Na+/proline symporter